LEKAQSVAEAIRKKTPDSVNALLLEGLVAKMRGQSKAAEEALTKVLTIDPLNAAAPNLLALLLIDSAKQGDKEKALSYAQLNAQRFANSSQANITLAWVLSKIGKPTEAQAALTRGIQAGNVNADSLYLIAKMLAQQNQKDNAKAFLEQLLQQSSVGTFMYRKDAEALLKELKGEVATDKPATDKPAADQPPADKPSGAKPPATKPGGGK